LEPPKIPGRFITTIPRISCFLGNAAVESAAFTTFEEDQRFTHASALMNAHKAAFPTEKSTDGYLGNPQAVANRAYSSEFQPSLGNGRFGNGNGWKYRGRGIFQITGLYNYTLFSKFTGIDAVSNRDILLQPEGAVASAFWFWNSNNFNHLADVYMFQQIGARINGTNPPYKWLEREQYRTFSAARIIERMLSGVLQTHLLRNVYRITRHGRASRGGKESVNSLYRGMRKLAA